MYVPHYDEAFKAAIIERVRNGEAPEALWKELGRPRANTIRQWVFEANRTKDFKKVIHENLKATAPSTQPIPSSNPPIPQAKSPNTLSRVLVIPDMHHPFCHPDTLDFLRAVRDAYQTDKVLCLGDEIDACAFSRYPMNPDGMSAGKELSEAIEHLRPFYREFPNVLVCESNHTIRPWKKAFDAGLPAAFLPTVSKILDAPDGWIWKNRHEIDGVLYTHGDNGKSGQYAAANYMKQAKQSVVIGHVHAYASVFYEGAQFGMNAGCLIDKEAYCFHYAKGALLDVNIGCGVVIEGRQAHFIPMLMDENKRWIGKL